MDHITNIEHETDQKRHYQLRDNYRNWPPWVSSFGPSQYHKHTPHHPRRKIRGLLKDLIDMNSLVLKIYDRNLQFRRLWMASKRTHQPRPHPDVFHFPFGRIHHGANTRRLQFDPPQSFACTNRSTIFSLPAPTGIHSWAPLSFPTDPGHFHWPTRL